MLHAFPITNPGAELTAFGDPMYVDEDRDVSIESAQVWTLHLRAVDGADLLDRVLEIAPKLGAYLGHLGGDSWGEWVSRADQGDPIALHVYFAADDRYVAQAIAEAFCAAHEILNTEVALSTGQDFAEQIGVATARADFASSASSQHYIDTGRRLPEGVALG
jgi:hypothetical protein